VEVIRLSAQLEAVFAMRTGGFSGDDEPFTELKIDQILCKWPLTKKTNSFESQPLPFKNFYLILFNEL
jgi:hypothetical protein